MKYVVTYKPDENFGEVNVYTVLPAGQEPHHARRVWVNASMKREGQLTARCVSCHGVLTAMSASCEHARAVKRHLQKEASAG